MWKTAALVVFLAGGICALWTWRHYPAAPDPRTASISDLVRFAGTDDFNRMYGWHRQRYARAMIGRLNELSLLQLMALLTDHSPGNLAALRNLRQLPGYDELAALAVRLFLDKFYHQDKWVRDGYLWMFVLNEKLQSQNRPPHDGMPDFKRVKTDMKSEMTRVMTQQPPQTLAQMGQFLVDLKQKRQSLGMPDRF